MNEKEKIGYIQATRLIDFEEHPFVVEENTAIIRELDDDSAVLEMVDSNLQRENIKPSEKAYAYKMKLQALQNNAKVNGRFGQVDQKQKGDASEGINSRKELAKQLGESERQIQRYIRLTNLRR